MKKFSFECTYVSLFIERYTSKLSYLKVCIYIQLIPTFLDYFHCIEDFEIIQVFFKHHNRDITYKMERKREIDDVSHARHRIGPILPTI